MLATFPRPAIFAHRGASAHAPENTLAAFDLAIQQGAHAIELDARLSADQHVVVIHDPTVDRTTDGRGRVSKLTLKELRRLDAGSHFDSRYAGLRIPSLAEVFETLSDAIAYNVELADYTSPTDRLPVAVAALIEKFNLADRVLLSSFNPLALIHLRRVCPTVSTALLVHRGIIGAWVRTWVRRRIHHQALHPHYLDITPAMIARLHEEGRRVHAYTVNEETDMRHLFGLGVDGLFTDDPQRAGEVLGKVDLSRSRLD